MASGKRSLISVKMACLQDCLLLLYNDEVVTAGSYHEFVVTFNNSQNLHIELYHPGRSNALIARTFSSTLSLRSTSLTKYT